MQIETNRWYESYLGQERFGSFLTAANGDQSRAIALIDWDREMRGELQKGLGEWEIALRNAYDATLSAWWTGSAHWLIDPASPVQAPIGRDGMDLNSRTRVTIAKAVQRAGDGAAPGQLIANLTLDFWRYLSVKAREKSLWVPALHRAYPRGSNRARIDHEVDLLYRLRNRVAHHEPVFRKPLPQLAVQLFLSCEQICPELADSIQVRGTIVDLWKLRPVS